jgi:hypothetical protein
MNQATLTGRPILYILWIGRKLNILIPNSRYTISENSTRKAPFVQNTVRARSLRRPLRHFTTTAYRSYSTPCLTTA